MLETLAVMGGTGIASDKREAASALRLRLTELLAPFAAPAPQVFASPREHYRLRAGAFFEIGGNRITRLTMHYNLADWIDQVSA